MPETYIHRIGRTGRAGKSGQAISFCSLDEVEVLQGIEKYLGHQLIEVENHKFLPLHMALIRKRDNYMKDYIYKYETHCHTKEVSECGKSYVIDLIDGYVKAGYAGIVLTDHFFNGNCDIDENLDWQSKVERFVLPFKIAKEHIKKYDNFSVFFGWEYNYKGTEFLTYGLDENFLYNHPTLLSWSTKKYLEEVHNAGGFIIHAHPFRRRAYIKKIRFYPEYIDAVEVANGGNLRYHDLEVDRLAENYAKELGLPGTRGTDCHNVNEIIGQGILLNKKVKTFEELILAIKEKEFR